MPVPEEPASLAQAVDAQRAAQRVVSVPVAALATVVAAVLAQVPAELPETQALADTSELFAQVERLRAGLLGRVADVDPRKLYVADGASRPPDRQASHLHLRGAHWAPSATV